MKISKTIVFFTLTGLTGLFAWMETLPLNDMLLQFVCHVPANAEIVTDECTGKMVQFGGKILAGVSAVGVFLRAVTTSSIFVSMFSDKKE